MARPIYGLHADRKSHTLPFAQTSGRSVSDWKFLNDFGPSIFPGIRSREWLALLRDNRFRVEPGYAVRAASITACSMVNSVLGWCENLRLGASLRATQVAAPLFILGHWRSGTTLLQNLFALDERFATPTLLEVFFPHTFLTFERLLRLPLSLVVPRRRYNDNMRFGIDVPHEDELALCTMTLCSPHLGLVFPERVDYYDRFLTLRGIPDAHLQRWCEGLMTFLRKLTLKHRRPLVLKSPPHTARIRVLLAMFPDAKFIHIHREPYAVFQSTVRMLTDSSRRQRLQRLRGDTVEHRVLRWYRLMYDAFFDERALIPEGRFHEVRFGDLERDIVGVLRHSYEALGLPDFGEIEPDVRRYAAAIHGYHKAVYDPLAKSLQQQIATQWQRSFHEWGYLA